MTKLSFAIGNAKLNKQTAIFSLPAGYTCPGASACLSRAHRITGKITDGKDNQFRCYAASGEAIFKNIRISRWNNFEALSGKSQKELVELINFSLPRKGIKLIRVHASGDFFSQTYFDAWLEVARLNPDLIFYAYTKALPFWLYRLNQIPINFKLTASKGGKFDAMIDQYGLKFVEVVFSKAEAKAKGLPMDKKDTLAWRQAKPFSILLHGTQPKGTTAAKAWSALKGISGHDVGNYMAHYQKPNQINA